MIAAILRPLAAIAATGAACHYFAAWLAAL
jgi:hypothetical protein